ncbi:hypothetical protein [Halomarina oriensis]|uniref:Uncharacterized protein n=1 Tax=Halomarina oriensis TaxID=671145 RepID=A0A6B0GNX2_9EURY|nr:hypothetical protein [Halomarina oriensis]MWG36494.1 hypothetical protein [Halomarina oriensis]
MTDTPIRVAYPVVEKPSLAPSSDGSPADPVTHREFTIETTPQEAYRIRGLILAAVDTHLKDHGSLEGVAIDVHRYAKLDAFLQWKHGESAEGLLDSPIHTIATDQEVLEVLHDNHAVMQSVFAE